MMARLAPLAGVALSLGLVTAAPAAQPASGTLSLDSGPIEFSQGPNVAVNPTPLAEASCLDPLPVCDHFDLTIDLPEDIGAFFPSALVRMVFTWDDPAGAGADDYDIYLYDASGNLVNSAETFEMPEAMSQLARGGVANFRFDIVYFTALGSTYTGRIELDLGEPAPGVDAEGFLEDNSLLAESLKPSRAASTPTAYVARREAAGAAGVWVLGLLTLLGLRRRRG